MCDATPGQVVLGCMKRKADGPEEMAQWLKELAIPAEALRSVPSTHMAAISRDALVPGIWHPILAWVESRHTHDVQMPNIQNFKS